MNRTVKGSNRIEHTVDTLLFKKQKEKNAEKLFVN